MLLIGDIYASMLLADREIHMKGVIFNVLEEMVTKECDLATWNLVLEECAAEGIYTAGESYPDSELFLLVESISRHTGIAQESLIGAFGEFLFQQLAARYPIFVESESTLKSFLKSVDSVIHMEVKKLYDSPGLPSFTYFEPSEDQLIMKYTSPRKLCILAEGLIRGAATYYKTDISISHPVCMHKGSDHCDLIIRFL